jgi:RES domain-containing protein
LTPTLTSLKTALVTVSPVTFQCTLARVVPLNSLQSVTPPQFLYITGRPYRYNLANVNCIYFSETKDVAHMEYDTYWAGTPKAHQTVVLYYADITIAKVLDLTNLAVLTSLNVNQSDLFKPWRTATTPTVTQLIGTAVQQTGHCAAIRYPSAAAHAINKTGNNFVIFKDHLQATDSVRIIDPAGATAQTWP